MKKNSLTGANHLEIAHCLHSHQVGSCRCLKWSDERKTFQSCRWLRDSIAVAAAASYLRRWTLLVGRNGSQSLVKNGTILALKWAKWGRSGYVDIWRMRLLKRRKNFLATTALAKCHIICNEGSKDVTKTSSVSNFRYAVCCTVVMECVNMNDINDDRSMITYWSKSAAEVTISNFWTPLLNPHQNSTTKLAFAFLSPYVSSIGLFS